MDLIFNDNGAQQLRLAHRSVSLDIVNEQTLLSQHNHQDQGYGNHVQHSDASVPRRSEHCRT
jgi:hypothetical protein